MAAEAKVPLSAEFVKELVDLKVYDRMKNLFHVATSVTLLVAILPSRYANMTVSRDQLVSVCVFIDPL
jgi:hypothetical protein